MEQNYRITYSLGSVKFEIESTDREWTETKEKEYLARLSEIPASLSRPNESATTTQPIPQNLTINEFFKRYVKKAKIESRTDISVFFVYYLERIVKKQPISSGDVTQCFADVAYPSFNQINIADVLNKARTKGQLNNVNKTWSLTLTGEDFVLSKITEKTE